MTRDFALRIDMLMTGVRASLDSIASYMKDHVGNGDLSEDEFQKLVRFIGTSMGETTKISNELYRLFPDITPDELK